MAILATFMTPLKSDINETLKLWFETHKKWLNSAKNLLRVGLAHNILVYFWEQLLCWKIPLAQCRNGLGQTWSQTQPLTHP